MARDLGSARVTSLVVVDRGVACIVGDSQGFLSIFINEENASRDIGDASKQEQVPALQPRTEELMSEEKQEKQT